MSIAEWWEQFAKSGTRSQRQTVVTLEQRLVMSAKDITQRFTFLHFSAGWNQDNKN